MKLDKSLKYLDKALKFIPKGTQTASKCYDQWSLGTAPVFCNKSKGPYIWDVDGNKYIDYMMALGPIILGYNDKRANRAISRQLKKGSLFSLSSVLEVELAELICEVVPCAEMVRFGKNGSDVTSIAVRIARHYTGKELILSPEGHYHGWSDIFAATSNRKYGMPLCMQSLMHRFKYNDLEDLEQRLKTNQYGAVIMEPVSLFRFKEGFLRGVRSLCDQYNTILIFDEMITGFRWSLGGAQEYYGVTPDIATFGKAVANGMPLAFVAGKEKYMQALNDVFYSGTYLGETLSLAAAIATINVLRKERHLAYEKIWSNGEKLSSSFNQHCKAIGLDAEMFGWGPRKNIKFGNKEAKGAKDLFLQEVISRGVFMGSQIYTSLAHSNTDIKKTILAIKDSLDVVCDAINNEKIDQVLRGTGSGANFKEALGAQ